MDLLNCRTIKDLWTTPEVCHYHGNVGLLGSCGLFDLAVLGCYYDCMPGIWGTHITVRLSLNDCQGNVGLLLNCGTVI